jgi:Flp pilus assembly pilin Flp
MRNLMKQLINDEAGFIVSAELVLVSTIAVLAMVVGLSELSHNVTQELEDVGSAFSCVDQSYHYELAHGHKGCSTGSSFHDESEYCEGQWDIHATKKRGGEKKK